MEQHVAPRRDGGVDLVKALAICAVLLIHCGTDHYTLHPIGSPPWLAADFYGGVTRWAVPAFLMCSGALMNAPDRDLPLRKLFSRYLLRLLAALAVWSALYELLGIAAAWGAVPLAQQAAQAAKNLFYGQSFYHLYYFYFAFSLYLALPLTRLIARWGGEAEVRYLLGLWLLFGGVFPFLQYFWPLREMKGSLLYYVLPEAFLCPGLGLLGWYMRAHPPKSWRPGALLFAAGFAVTFLGTWVRSVHYGVSDRLFLTGFGPFVLLMAAGVFRLCQWAVAHWNRPPRPVQFLSAASFCVYLVHPFFQSLTVRTPLAALPPWWGIPLHAAVLLALSLAAYLVLRRIPVVNRWLI